jgi:hypothetical protein
MQFLKSPRQRAFLATTATIAVLALIFAGFGKLVEHYPAQTLETLMILSLSWVFYSIYNIFLKNYQSEEESER